MKTLSVTLLAIVAGATSAHAETFSDPFIGAQISRDAYEVKAEGTDLGFATLDLDGLSGNGVGGGLYVGYDYALSNTVFFGVEANANFSGASISAQLDDVARDLAIGAGGFRSGRAWQPKGGPAGRRSASRPEQKSAEQREGSDPEPADRKQCDFHTDRRGAG